MILSHVDCLVSSILIFTLLLTGDSHEDTRHTDTTAVSTAHTQTGKAKENINISQSICINMLCMCVYFGVSFCVCTISLYLARSMLFISHLGHWDSSNLSKSGITWLHGTSDRCRLSVLYLKGLFQFNLYAWLCVTFLPSVVCWDKPIYEYFICDTAITAAAERTKQEGKWELRVPFKLTQRVQLRKPMIFLWSKWAVTEPFWCN